MFGTQKGDIRILTNHGGQGQSPTWRSATTYVHVKKNSVKEILRVGLELLLKSGSHDCLVLGAGKSDMAFAMVQSLLPVSRKPCIMIDCLWYADTNLPRAFLKTAMMHLVDRSVDQYVVWASREIDAYSREFLLPKNKFSFIPYHTTLDTVNVEARDEGYLFSGGYFSRDYGTLLQAVRGFSKPLLIASTRPKLFEKYEIPGNVTVRGFSHEEYIKKMAACAINIVAMAPGLLHSGGQQTFLNSMYLGKPTIVTDPDGARDYIEDGKDGILVEPGNAGALRNAITWLLDHPGEARKMGDRARKKVEKLTTEDHFKKIVELAEEIVGDRTRS